MQCWPSLLLSPGVVDNDRPLTCAQSLAPADFVIEAVRENEDIKRSLFMRLDQVNC